MCARVLWVGADPPGPSSRLEIVAEANVEAAATRAREESWTAVVVDGPPDDVATVLAAAKEAARVPQRMATSSYAGMPALVRDVEVGLVERVLARPVELDALEHAVLGATASESVLFRRALNAPNELSPASVDERLRLLVTRFVEVRNVVIRSMIADHPVPRLQLVVPISDPLQELRRDLPRLLGWPLKASGSAMGSAYRNHPVRKQLGALSEAQEVYCLGGKDYGYVALFPWEDNMKVTVVIGYGDRRARRVEQLHAHAVAVSKEFPLPTRYRHSPQLFYDPDYDWVITKNYVGPDRRRKKTSLLNRYTFFGRRKALMPNEFSTVTAFVDVAPRWAWIAAVVLGVLFVVDTAMTAKYVGSGAVGELNPVMRWALERGAVVFWTLKSAIAVVFTFVVLRWHLWTPGRWIFGLCIALYAVIDVNWLLLYLG